MAVVIPGLPFAGFVGAKRVGIYVLDPTLTTPIIPVALDLLPTAIPNPLQVSLDVAESITRTHTFTVTTNQLLDFASVTTNVHEELATASVAGIIDPFPLTPTPALMRLAPPTFGVFRKDILVKNILIAIAKLRRPVLMVTPDWSMARCFIQEISETQNAGDGEVTRIGINVIECRLVPTPSAVAQDAAAMTGGANQSTNAGATGGTDIQTPNALAGGGLG